MRTPTPPADGWRERTESAESRWYVFDDPGDGTVVLRHGGRMGPAPSGLSIAIEAMPDKEERIVARRLDDPADHVERDVERDRPVRVAEGRRDRVTGRGEGLRLGQREDRLRGDDVPHVDHAQDLGRGVQLAQGTGTVSGGGSHAATLAPGIGPVTRASAAAGPQGTATH